MELGNMMFGHSRGEFAFPDRSLARSEEWKALSKIDIEYDGIDNEVFTIRPYSYTDDEMEETLPNFVYKPTGFEINWYKHAFRDSYMNQALDIPQILDIFKKCVESINTAKG